MLINIRGTNGSGKSTVVRELLDKANRWRPFYDAFASIKAEAYELDIPKIDTPVFDLGSYHVGSGGCDQIQPYDLILDLIRKYADRGHVVFEGFLIGTCWGIVGERLEREGKNAVVAFLDTSLEQCIANVRKRRAERGDDDRPFDSDNLTSKYRRIVEIRKRIAEAGRIRVIDIDTFGGADAIIQMVAECEKGAPLPA